MLDGDAGSDQVLIDIENIKADTTRTDIFFINMPSNSLLDIETNPVKSGTRAGQTGFRNKPDFPAIYLID
jgi:hypothetical protein